MAFLDRSIEVPARAKLHDLAPSLVLVLDEIHSLNDVEMVQCRGDAVLCSELLDVFFLRFVLAPLPEFLRGEMISIRGPVFGERVGNRHRLRPI